MTDDPADRDLRADLIDLAGCWLDHARARLRNTDPTHRAFGAALAQRSIARVVIERLGTHAALDVAKSVTDDIATQLGALRAAGTTDVTRGWMQSLEAARSALLTLADAHLSTRPLAGQLEDRVVPAAFAFVCVCGARISEDDPVVDAGGHHVCETCAHAHTQEHT